MALLYTEVKLLLRYMRAARKTADAGLDELAENFAADWLYLHQPHY